MVTIKDIAKAVGVSSASVSFTLNGKAKEKRISIDLSEKIIKTAEAMGYQPNRMAVGLRTGKSKTIGLIVENISNIFFSTLAKTVEDEARKFGVNVVYCSTENDPAKGREVIQMLYHQQVDGYLITPTHGMEVDIKKLISRNKPVVLMDRFFPGVDVPHVVVNNYSGMMEGISYLFRQGFTKIGFVTINMELLQISERTRAYRDSLSGHNIRYMKSRVLVVDYNNSPQQSVGVIMDFMQQNADLEVIIFSTNYLGIYGLQAIKKLKLSVPSDLHIMNFDDHDMFDLCSPGITAIKQPIDAIARNALSILVGELGYGPRVANRQIELQTELIIREST